MSFAALVVLLTGQAELPSWLVENDQFNTLLAEAEKLVCISSPLLSGFLCFTIFVVLEYFLHTEPVTGYNK